MAAIALAAILLPLWIVATSPRLPPPVLSEIKRTRRVVPRAELPPVEPVRLASLPQDDARRFNAGIPFSTAPNPAARPFRITGSPESQARAIDCLAAATWYEAGDDAVGQRAVAQVVLNRMRHPAFPKSICGVVFQGQERRTGCQFTFTCDGAMRRAPSPAAWGRAQSIARSALTGGVFGPVGHSTHYHTDWVVPYWSSSLDKVAEVHTHLFFRWTGWWGTPPAFRRAYAGSEPVISRMATLSPAHRDTAPGILLEDGGVDPASVPDSAISAPVSGGDGNSFHVLLDPALGADTFAAVAIRTCGERPYCKFLGWTDRRNLPAPGRNPSPAQLQAMSFSYLRDQSQGFGKALWNCTEFRRPSAVQCMRRLPSAMPTPAASPQTVLKGFDPSRLEMPGPDGLAGVRRKNEVAPPVIAAPTPRSTPKAP